MSLPDSDFERLVQAVAERLAAGMQPQPAPTGSKQLEPACTPKPVSEDDENAIPIERITL